jgi:cytosine/adenosine deaminase-related metal-dependent hydrolase
MTAYSVCLIKHNLPTGCVGVPCSQCTLEYHGFVDMSAGAGPTHVGLVQYTIPQQDSVSCVALQARGCGRVTASLIPRFIPTCSQQLLSGLGQLAQQEGLLVHSHISESRSAACAAAHLLSS